MRCVVAFIECLGKEGIVSPSFDTSDSQYQRATLSLGLTN